jgi:transcriptional regulator
MYIHPKFEITDKALIRQFVQENGFATLVSVGKDFPTATHIPLFLEQNADGRDILHGHISKANPQWREFLENPAVLAIFLSPIHAYVSSSWYNHPNAPTWNYMTAHLSGTIRLIEGEELYQSLTKLSDKYEQGMAKPFSLPTAPEPVQKQVGGVVGFEILVEKMECSFKLSQNRDDESFETILRELRASPDVNARLLAEAMAQHRAANKA